MPDELPTGDTGPDDLVLKAMLYAAGELDPDESAAFELRLAEDQAARDALCQAVELTQLDDAGPDPAYRSQVRHRLRMRRRRLGFSESGFLGNHPAFWAVLGAVVAVLVLIILSHLIATMSMPGEPRSTQPRPTPPDADLFAQPVTPEVASTWAELNSAPEAPPRFTPEREAAALFYVQKQLPELMPFLTELKKASPPRYEQEVGRIFQETERIANLNEAGREELEVRSWKAQTRAHMLLARLAPLSESRRPQAEAALRPLAQELAEINATRTGSRVGIEKFARDRQEAWLDQLTKSKK